MSWHESIFTEENFQENMTNKVHPWINEHVVNKKILSLDGTPLNTYYALNPNKGKSITIVHGYCEFFTKYHEMMYIFYQAGYSVFFLELRGHGLSAREVDDPSLVHVDDYSQYVDDVFAFQDQVVIPNSRGDVHILLGHSMGGCVSALVLERFPDLFDKAILSSPMLELDMSLPIWKVGVLAMLNMSKKERMLPAPGTDTTFYSIPRFERSSCLSKERFYYQFRERAKHREYQTWTGTVGWSAASLKAMKNALDHAKDVKTPVLLLKAEKDHLVLPGGQNFFVSQTKKAVTIMVPNSKHEIFNSEYYARLNYYELIFTFLETPITKEA